MMEIRKRKKKIKIWEDRWLPSRGTFQVQSPTKILPKSVNVKELFSTITSDWNEDIIKAIFWEDETKTILSIQLGTINLEDKLIWVSTKNGAFIVKSAYFLAIKRKEEDIGGPSNLYKQNSRWKRIWQLAVPPKV